ncbi:MAG: hypothetical protein CMB65_04435 [Euryarchaeota archaeon]|nr:hypothetical protein [Euryarchaeota archaeon]
MASSYDNNLRLREMGTGDESGTWGTRTNENLELIGEALGYGTESITTNADTHTTTIADGSTDPGRAIYLKYTGSLDSACTITIAPNTISKLWFIENGTSGSQSIIISQGSGANVTIPTGKIKAVFSDGAGSGAAITDAFNALDLGSSSSINGTALGTMTASTTDTFTNKTFDANGTGNSISNIENADISASAAIAFSKMANLTTARALVSDGSGDVSVSDVTSTELGYLDGVTSAIQTQLGTKLNAALPNDAWISSADSRNRLYFTTNGSTILKFDTNFLVQNNSGTTMLTTDTSGNFTATGNVGAYSDLALKEDIYQIENALDKVKKLRGVHFTRKANNSKEIGVVANEVEKVVPELVDEHEDKELGTVKTMKYANTVGLLIEAVKDLSKQIEELKNE